MYQSRTAAVSFDISGAHLDRIEGRGPRYWSPRANAA